MPTRWHMMSEKQLSILIQGRNYARGNWQIIKFPGHSHAYQRELPDYDVALCKLTKFPRNPRDCACSQRHFTKPFFPLEVHIVCTATSREEPIFAHINMHGFGWKFLAPSSSCARNSAMEIAERSSLKILPNPNTIISHTWPRHSTWSSTGPAGHVLSPSLSKMEASKFPRSGVGECAVLLIAGLCISTLSQTPTVFPPPCPPTLVTNPSSFPSATLVPSSLLLLPPPPPPPPPPPSSHRNLSGLPRLHSKIVQDHLSMPPTNAYTGLVIMMFHNPLPAVFHRLDQYTSAVLHISVLRDTSTIRFY